MLAMGALLARPPPFPASVQHDHNVAKVCAFCVIPLLLQLRPEAIDARSSPATDAVR